MKESNLLTAFGDWSHAGVKFKELPYVSDVIAKYEKEANAPHLGCATTRELIREIEARIEVDGKLDYKTTEEDQT